MENIIEKDDKKPPGLAVKVSKHLRQLAKKSKAIEREFFKSDEEDIKDGFKDPLVEDEYEKVLGLIWKYPKRVLILMTKKCASYCRFCTRRRRVDEIKNSCLTKIQMEDICKFLEKKSEISEVVISGGDPLAEESELIYFINQLKKIKSLKIIRIHTRVPVSNPDQISQKFYESIAKIKRQVVYISVHFEHPDELTKKTIEVIKKLRQAGAIMLSQSVFLKGVNDSFEVLEELFTKLTFIGVRPYYLYRCDPVAGAKHFQVDFEKERQIATRLKAELSGIACPTYVIDAPLGSGKIPVALGFWGKCEKRLVDFEGKTVEFE